MIFLAALIASILMMTTLIIALRLTGDAGFLRSWWIWIFAVGFVAWGPVLYVVFWRWLGSGANGDVITTYAYLFGVTLLAAFALMIVFDSFDTAALSTGGAFVACCLGVNVAALFAKEPLPAAFTTENALLAPVAWNAGLAAVMIPLALRARRINLRAANRQCLHCGFDLRAVLRSHLCPECGEPFREPREHDLPVGGA